MPSAVMNILQVPKHPYDHETSNITLAILMSTAGKVIVQIFDLIMYNFVYQSDPVTCCSEMGTC